MGIRVESKQIPVVTEVCQKDPMNRLGYGEGGSEVIKHYFSRVNMQDPNSEADISQHGV